MNDDLDRAIDRLAFAIQNEPSRKISFLFGSGLSLPAVPGTNALVSLLCDATGALAGTLKEQARSLDAGAAYRLVAHEVRQRRGESGLARTLRAAVLQAYSGNEAIDGHGDGLDDSAWLLPAPQLSLAQLIARIPPQQRGPLFTTNFDPLAEVALRLRNVQTATISAPAGVAIPLDGIYGTLPVVHLHGFWLHTATLSTGEQLIRPRPEIESMLQRHLSQSIVVVVGYAGWDDSFTRALRQVVQDGRWALMSGELLWMNYAKDESSALLQSIIGAPGVNIYSGIDATALFDGVSKALTDFRRASRDAYPGWTPVPSANYIEPAAAPELTAFAEGIQPTWSVASGLPLLDMTKSAQARLGKMLDSAHDGVVALCGPTGEGKSLALMQLGVALAEQRREVVTLMRDPTAPTITEDWLAHLRRRASVTVIMVDEADLVLSEFFTAYSPPSGGEGIIVVVMALHSHFEQVLRNRAALASVPIDIVSFTGFTRDDAVNIADAWKRAEILPPEHQSADTASIAELIVSSGSSNHGNSLFGAVLHLWMGDDLKSRIDYLLTRLERTSIRGRTLRQLLCAVALTQDCWDIEEQYSMGLTLEALGSLCGTHSRDVIPLVIAPLGREVGLAQVGDCVYIRHPSIAEGIVEAISHTSELNQTAFMIGEAGGRLRTTGETPRSAWLSAYRLFENLEGEARLAAARGAVIASPGRLEPRVSLLSVARKVGKTSLSEPYSRELLTHLREYRDYRTNVRGLYVECAMVELTAGRYAAATGYACASLSDLDATPMNEDQLRYGLVVSARASASLSGQDRSARPLHQAVMDLLARVPYAAEVYSPVRRHQVKSPSIVQAVGRFRRASAHLGAACLPAGQWKFAGLLDAMGRQTPSSLRSGPLA